MGVRVELRICRNSRCIEVPALVNTGFESYEPELVIPLQIAEELGIEIGDEISVYTVAGGGKATAMRGRDRVKVSLVVEDRDVEPVEALVTILPGEEEVLISDRLAHDLGIVVLDPFEGLWCLREEIGKKVRKSVSSP